MTRPRLLDLFCCQGGASMGYYRAGFDVTGVDIATQAHYPFDFHRGDALAFVAAHGAEFDAIAASPPCQAYTTLAVLSDVIHPELIAPTRDALVATGRPYVIENVAGAAAHLRDPLQLCGSEFALSALCADGVRRQLRRHRLFESNVWLMGAGGCHHKGQPLGVYGTGGGGPMTRGHKATRTEAAEVLGITWMSFDGLSQAIPPAYTQFIGEQLLTQLGHDPEALRRDFLRV